MFSALHIPGFALQSRLRLDPAGLTPAAILVEDVTKNSLVLEANTAARNQKIVPGLSSTQAIARDPSVRIFARCLATEIRTAQSLQNLCLSISPITEETRRGLYISDLRGVEKLQPKALARHILKETESLGLASQTVFAPTADLAEFGSQSSTSRILIIDNPQAFLESCPTTAASPNPELLEVLNLWGIQTLGAFTKIPIEAISERFGESGRELWERAMGRKRRLLLVQPESPHFHESLDLEYPLSTLEPLLFIIRRFVDDLCRQLQQAHLLAASMHLSLGLEDNPKWENTIQLPEAICWADTLFAVLEKSLEDIQMPGAIIRISLKIDPIEPSAQQRQIFETSIKNPWRFADTIDRLAAIVGEDNIGTPTQLDTHRPDSIKLSPLKHTLEDW
ncbi:MAG: hypothetical protein AAGB06_04500, partial [Verrucomicrobiota bacterium]